jgi:N-acetylglucosaminyldiphosphoundecaprenol N-acetyl-beta-D-mannosaminyltransferase
MNKISIMDVGLNNTTKLDASETIKNHLEKGGNEIFTIFTPNTEIIMFCNNDSELKRIINKGSLVLPDGIGLIYASRIRRLPLKERVTGYDTSIEILNIAVEKDYKVFLLGGAPGVAEKATENIRKEFGDIVCGHQHGYFKGQHVGHADHEEEKKIIKRINELKPDIIFVGLGSPKQEKWIEYHRNNLDVKLVIGNGGTIDVLSGTVKRAPQFFQKLGLEWLYRLLSDPKRIKRQILLPIFILKILFGPKDIVKNQ